MGVARQYLVAGIGQEALERCYQLLGIQLEDLPRNPQAFTAAGRQDGLVTYKGHAGAWEATISMEVAQAAQLCTISSVQTMPVE